MVRFGGLGVSRGVLHHAGLPQNEGSGKGESPWQEEIEGASNSGGGDRAREPRAWMGRRKMDPNPREVLRFWWLCGGGSPGGSGKPRWYIA